MVWKRSRQNVNKEVDGHGVFYLNMAKKKKETQNDVTWKHCTKVGDGKKAKLKCNYCGKEYSGGNFRIKHHLAYTRENVVACAKVESGVKEFFFKLLKENKMKKQLLGDEYDGGDEERGAEFVGEKRKLALDAFAQRFQPSRKKSSGPRDLKLKDKGKGKVQEVEKEKEDTSEDDDDDDDGVESEEDVSSMDDD
ncbi:hypothetical protein IFM89_001701 [Coptis chinensis]|uniref:BED-type domain-containing protein n=1 Tax=Coptis chinensis TaxID=261450 RepID=A0A835LLW0_9MAGN|nr:hypothetical protein IFM89_001701 [Coptis chinensis]